MKNAQGGDKVEPLTFYCQVDTYLGVKDYLRGGRCVRLIGVDQADFASLNQQELGGGVTSFVLDIDLSEYIRKVRSTLWSRRRDELRAELDRWEIISLGERPWFRVDLEMDAKGASYFYTTFSAMEPERFKLLKVAQVKSLDLAALLEKVPRTTARMLLVNSSEAFNIARVPIEMKGASPYKFSAFHVGQGMCSAVYNDSHAVLFDAGAGTPVTRKRYLTEQYFLNGLNTVIKSRSIPYLVLSHYDHDHWRLLAWDENLLNKVQKVIAPDVPGISVAFFDTKLLGRVHKWDSLCINLGSSGVVFGKRSEPKYPDANGECLVSLVILADRNALVPGDYVYQRMVSDGNAWIAGLQAMQFAAVIVPHHGDEASARNVPVPQNDAKAFFSAGNHKGYCHPAVESVTAHSKAGFKNMTNPYQPYIVEVPLL